MTVKGIDISAYQGNVKAGVFQQNSKDIPYVILRCSYTAWRDKFTMYEDKCFQYNIKAAIKAGVKIGIYHYSQAISETEAIKEAEFVIKLLKPFMKYITFYVAFDMEFGGRFTAHVAKKMGKQRCKQIADAYCRTIQAAGFKPMLYANLSTLNAYIASDVYKSWPIWIAQYNSRCDYKHPYLVWQYTSSGRVSGIPGNIDMNKIYLDQPKPEEKPYTGQLPKIPKRGWFTSGDKGEEVKKLQRFLNWYGDYGLKVDGIVGAKTMYAVKLYQGREKLKPIDNLFGPKCLERAKTVRR